MSTGAFHQLLISQVEGFDVLLMTKSRFPNSFQHSVFLTSLLKLQLVNSFAWKNYLVLVLCYAPFFTENRQI